MESRFMMMQCTVGARVNICRARCDCRSDILLYRLPSCPLLGDLWGIRYCQDTLLPYARRHVVVLRLKQRYDVSMKSLSPGDLKLICRAESFSVTFIAPPQRGQRQVAGGWGE